MQRSSKIYTWSAKVWIDWSTIKYLGTYVQLTIIESNNGKSKKNIFYKGFKIFHFPDQVVSVYLYQLRNRFQKKVVKA